MKSLVVIVLGISLTTFPLEFKDEDDLFDGIGPFLSLEPFSTFPIPFNASFLAFRIILGSSIFALLKWAAFILSSEELEYFASLADFHRLFIIFLKEESLFNALSNCSRASRIAFFFT